MFDFMSVINMCKCRKLLSLNIGLESRSQVRFTATLVNYDFLCIEDNMLNKLLGIFPPLAFKQRIKYRAVPWASFIFTKIFQVNLKDMSEGHYVLGSNWVLMMTTQACLRASRCL